MKGGENILFSGSCHLKEEKGTWQAYLAEEDDGKRIEVNRKHSLTGRPCGEAGFIRLKAY